MPFTSETAKLYRGPGGRKRKDPKEVAQAKRIAADIAREYIETHVEPVLENYFKLAKGWTEERVAITGDKYQVFRHDGQTTRHFIDKILPDDQPVNHGQINVVIGVAQAPAESDGSAPGLWANGLQIRLGNGDGQNGNGGNGA